MKKYLLLMSLLVVASGAYAENSTRLDETVISTTGFETRVKDEVKNINIITKEDIEKKNYTSVEEVLKDSPFIQTVNDGYGVTFDMRGQGSRATSRVKILVDGIPVNMMNMLYGTQCAFPVNNIPVDQVEKIEIVPGGGAVLYGNGTSGGFINIVTKNRKGTYASVGGSYGSYNNRKGDVNAGVQITDKLSADINYSGRNSDGYRDKEKTQIDNITGKIRYDITDNHKIIAKVEKYNENYYRTGSLTKAEMDEDRKMAAPDNFRDGKLTKENYLVGYLGKVGNIELTSAGFIENSHDKQLQNVDKKLTTFWVKEKKTGVSLKGKYPYAKGDLIVGYDFLREKADNLGVGRMGGNRFDVTKDTNSVYALNKYDFTDSLQLTAGVRGEFARYDLEALNKSGTTEKGKPSLDNYSYEAALNYLYSDTGNVYVKYERSFTSPNATEYFDKNMRKKPGTSSGGRPGMPSGMGSGTGTMPPLMAGGTGTGTMPPSMAGGTGTGSMPPSMTGGTRPTTMASMPGGTPTGTRPSGMPGGMGTGGGGRPPMMSMPSDATHETYYSLNDLDPEKTNTIEIGAKDIFGNVYVSATAYYSETKNEIIKNSVIAGGLGPIWTYNNQDTKRKGVELYSEQYFEKFTLNESISYVDAKIKSGPHSGKDVPYVAKWRGTIGGNYHFTDHLTVSLVGNVYSKIHNGWTPELNMGMKMPSRDKGHRKGYKTLDLSARYDFDNGLSVIAGINNILNEKYYLTSGKDFKGRGIADVYSPAPERNYYVGFKYQM